MTTPDLFRFAFGSLLGKRLRTALSLLGMAIGVGAVVILTALGEGARRYVTTQFASIGSNLLIVLPGKTETSGFAGTVPGAPNDLTLEDAEALRRRVPGVVRLSPLVMGTETVAHGARRDHQSPITNHRSPSSIEGRSTPLPRAVAIAPG